ncbi:MAG TPA: hypothetical protein VE593_08215, partial [Nitrososphaeraceae archaeon]|nr:hypothetical protein [Nitrososphaeraceae archaeon]
MIEKHDVFYRLILYSLVVVAVGSLSSTLNLEIAWADSTIKNIPTNNIPAGVAFDPANNYTYVTNADSNTVSVIDGSTNT